MDEKELEKAQNLEDEQLEDVVGGTRILAACADTKEQEAVEGDDDDEVDLLYPGFTIRCPLCGHSIA